MHGVSPADDLCARVRGPISLGKLGWWAAAVARLRSLQPRADQCLRNLGRPCQRRPWHCQHPPLRQRLCAAARGAWLLTRSRRGGGGLRPRPRLRLRLQTRAPRRQPARAPALLAPHLQRCAARAQGQGQSPRQPVRGQRLVRCRQTCTHWRARALGMARARSRGWQLSWQKVRTHHHARTCMRVPVLLSCGGPPALLFAARPASCRKPCAP